jgi:hypothetical protein
MEVSGDELAGVIDLFGELAPAELEGAIGELAFKRGEDPPDIERAVETALENYRLVAIEAEGDRAASTDGNYRAKIERTADSNPEQGDRLLVPGPTAFPVLPAGAADLPHIMEIDTREVGRERLEASVEERFRAEAAKAVLERDEERVEGLLDTSYDLEAWGTFDLGDVRARLDAASAAEE